jgi:hypothetical protein
MHGLLPVSRLEPNEIARRTAIQRFVLFGVVDDVEVKSADNAPGIGDYEETGNRVPRGANTRELQSDEKYL